MQVHVRGRVQTGEGVRYPTRTPSPQVPSVCHGGMVRCAHVCAVLQAFAGVGCLVRARIPHAGGCELGPPRGIDTLTLTLTNLRHGRN